MVEENNKLLKSLHKKLDNYMFPHSNNFGKFKIIDNFEEIENKLANENEYKSYLVSNFYIKFDVCSHN